MVAPPSPRLDVLLRYVLAVRSIATEADAEGAAERAAATEAMATALVAAEGAAEDAADAAGTAVAEEVGAQEAMQVGAEVGAEVGALEAMQVGAEVGALEAMQVGALGAEHMSSSTAAEGVFTSHELTAEATGDTTASAAAASQTESTRGVESAATPMPVAATAEASHGAGACPDDESGGELHRLLVQAADALPESATSEQVQCAALIRALCEAYGLDPVSLVMA